MTNPLRTASLAALVLAALPAAALAQPAKPAPAAVTKADAQARAAEMFARMDANQDGKLKYQGGDSDLNRKVQQLLTAPGNSAFALNFNDAVGYYSGDLNLDGKVKYSGADADNNWLFMNVVAYLRNTDAAPNFNLLVEQLPGN